MNFGSTEQEQAIRHGIGKRNLEWEPFLLPDPVPLPSRVKGFSINWMLGYSNSPTLNLILTKAPPEEEFLFENNNGLYLATNPEGFAQWHFHSGKPEKQDGYGGRSFTLRMRSGETKTLVGPWHVGAPAGIAEVYYKETEGRFPNLSYFGLGVTLPLLSAIVAKFKPGLQFCIFKEYGGKYLQPISPRFGVPKALVPDEYPEME